MFLTVFLNLEKPSSESSLLWKKQLNGWSSAFFWLLYASCSFLTTENLLCTCSNWVPNDKHLASSENCSIKSQPQMWRSTLIESLLRGVAFLLPRGGVSSPCSLFSSLNFDLSQILSSVHALLWGLSWPCLLFYSPIVISRAGHLGGLGPLKYQFQQWAFLYKKREKVLFLLCFIVSSLTP